MKRIYLITLALICLNPLHATNGEFSNPLRTLYNRAQAKLRDLMEAERTWTDETDEDEEVALDSVSQSILGEVKKLSDLDPRLKAEIVFMIKEKTGEGLNIPREYGQERTGHLRLSFHNGIVAIQAELLCAEAVAHDSVMARLAQKGIRAMPPYTQGCSTCQTKGMLKNNQFLTHMQCTTTISLAQFTEAFGIAQQ